MFCFSVLNVLLTVVAFATAATTPREDLLHTFSAQYPHKFTLSSELPVANVIPDQYIVVMNHNHSSITTQTTRPSFRKRTQSVRHPTRNLQTQEWISSTLALQSNFREQRGQDFRVQINAVYTRIFDGFSATLSPFAAKFVLDDPNVASVEPNMVATIAQQKNPPWNLDRIDQLTNQLDTVFDPNGLDGQDISIFVLDTGVNVDHNDFTGRVQNSVDFVKDGNGPSDCNGHGTHCASTALGTRWGVAKKALLNNVRVLGCDGSGSWSSILSGLDWSVDQIHNNHNIGVISMSLGGSKSSILDRSVANAVMQGAMVIVAAGNENTNACNTSPASETLVVAVGATTRNDARATFSNYGQCVDLFAPGVSIRAASHLSRGGTAVLSGTSMACPQVSGSTALEIQKMRIQGERITPDSVRAKLLASATKGVLSNLRGGPNLLLHIPQGIRSEPPFPTPAPNPQPPQPPKPPNDCVTEDNTPCVFPFIFKGIQYDSCTSINDPVGKEWCSTRTDASNRHISGSWGHCAPNCNNRPPLPTPLPTPRASPTNPTQPIDPVDCELLDAVNDVRTLNNLPPLEMDERLYQAARKHAVDMARRDYFSHVSPDGTTPSQRVSDEQYRWVSVAENIAAGYTSVVDVVNGWVNSAGHYRNIRCTRCTRTGIAKVSDPTAQWKNYYVQVFASGDDDASQLINCGNDGTDDIPPLLPPSTRPTARPTARPTVSAPTVRPSPVPSPVPDGPRNEEGGNNPQWDATCKTLARPDVPSQACIFPFVYKSVLYTHCTTIDYNQPWCATAVNQEGTFMNDQWGVCHVSRCRMNPEYCQLHSLNAPWSTAETNRLDLSDAMIKATSSLANNSFHAVGTKCNEEPRDPRNEQNGVHLPCSQNTWLFGSLIASSVCSLTMTVYVGYLQHTLRKYKKSHSCTPRTSTASL